jgi:hypothetical protein
MRIIKKIFLLLFLSPFCSSSSSATISNTSSLTAVLNFIEDPNRSTTYFFRKEYPAKFLFENYEDDPWTCLNWLLTLDNIVFEKFFFNIISESKHFYYLPLPISPFDLSDYIVFIIGKIKKMVSDILFKPCYSEEEMAKKFSIVEIFIKLSQKYAGYPGAASSSDYNMGKLQEFPQYLQSWRFVIKNLPRIAPMGHIDYLQFFSAFNWLISPAHFPVYKRSDYDYYFLFATLINHLNAKMDFDLFKVAHPELPFLVGLMLKNTEYIDYFHFYFYQRLKDFFGPKDRYHSLASVLEDQKGIIKAAKETLGFDAEHPCSLSFLIDSLERVPFACQDIDHHSMLWKLTGIALIEDFLKTSGFRKLSKEAKA